MAVRQAPLQAVLLLSFAVDAAYGFAEPGDLQVLSERRLPGCYLLNPQLGNSNSKDCVIAGAEIAGGMQMQS